MACSFRLRRLLYAHLDPELQATYDVLIAAGALPDIREGR
ncbi:MAG: DUF6400 family protein [Pseudonocardiaceae bacterium]